MSARVPAERIADPAVFGRVAVLMGGASSEREVSLDSGRGVLAALRSRGVDAHPVDGIPALVQEIAAGRVDRVFNILHGNRGGGEDGVVQGLLRAFGVPFTGPDVLGSALTMDKIRTKQVWIAEGLPTPGFVRVAGGAPDVAASLRARARGAPSAQFTRYRPPGRSTLATSRTISTVVTCAGVASPANTSRTTTSADASGSRASCSRASPARMRSAGERGSANQVRTSSGSCASSSIAI